MWCNNVVFVNWLHISESMNEINCEQVNRRDEEHLASTSNGYNSSKRREVDRCFRRGESALGNACHVSRGNKFEIHIKRLIMLWRIAKRCCTAPVREKLLSWPEGPRGWRPCLLSVTTLLALQHFAGSEQRTPFANNNFAVYLLLLCSPPLSLRANSCAA